MGMRPKQPTSEREVETKLSVHGLFVFPELVELGGRICQDRTLPVLSLRAVYWDTDDLRLLRAGVTLRHRTGEGAARWTLKLPNAGHASGLDREEVSVAAGADTVPEELADLVIPRVRGAQLLPVAVLATERTTHQLADETGSVLVEVADDVVSVLDGPQLVQRFREVEVEERSGAARAAREVIAQLTAAGATPADQVPKLVRALGPRALAPSDLPILRQVRPGDPAGALVQRALADGLLRIVAADTGVRRDAPDAVHQLRVACRRLRSDLRTFRPLLADDRVVGLRAELAWLADTLGSSRDLEVLRERLHRTAETDPLAPLSSAGLATVDALLAAQEQEGTDAALVALRSPRYLALLEVLVATATAPVLTDAAAGTCDAVVPELVAAAWLHLAKRAGRLAPDGPDETWHRARILAKRARYAAEAATPALGKKAQRLAKAATAVQTILGEHQDAAVAADRVMTLPAGKPRDQVLALTCGRLVERERAAVRAARRKHVKAWRRTARSSVADWLP